MNKRRRNKVIAHIDFETHSGVKLMQGHSPMVLAGVFHNSTIKPGMSIQGSLMGPDEYALRKLPKLRKKK